MDTYTGIFYIVAILAIVLFIGVFKNRAEWIINLILRGISGMLMIYFLNFLFENEVYLLHLSILLKSVAITALLLIPVIDKSFLEL